MDVNNIQFTKIEIQIAKYVFKHYKDRYNARQLAKILNINHAHAANLCNNLEKKGLLVKEKIGNSIIFSYAYKNKRALKFIEYILSLEILEIPKWLTIAAYNLKKFNEFVEMGLIFGSSLKTKDFNDIDVLLMYDSKKLNTIKKIKEEIRKSGLVENPIRYVDITKKDIVVNKEDKIFYDILSNSIVFHNPEKYVEVIRQCRKLKNT